VFLGVVSDALWRKFCDIFGFDALWADESLRANNQRVMARDRILPTVEAKMASMTREAIMAALAGSGIPFAPVSRPDELFDDPQLAEFGLEAVVLDDGRETRLPTLPLEMAGLRPGQSQRLPTPGADVRHVLARLGYEPEAIDGLISLGMVGST